MSADNLPPLPEMNEVEAKSELRRAWHDLDDVERRWRAAMRERDALARRMDAVRAYLDQVPREPHHPSRRAFYAERCEMAREIRRLLDGNAGDER